MSMTPDRAARTSFVWIADPAAPGQAATDREPFVPPGYRPATVFEIRLWQAREPFICAGRMPPEGLAAQVRAEYEAGKDRARD